MHGVGQHFAEDAFRAFGLKPFVPVKEQAVPDPEFPTVTFPNPEEGKSALVRQCTVCRVVHCFACLSQDTGLSSLLQIN